MQYCNEHGLPHSKFLAWDPIDRAKALAFVLEKNERCVMCGTAEWEWELDRFAYEPVEKFCHGCYLKDAAQDPDPNRNMAGITIELMPTNTIEAAKRYVKAKRKYERSQNDVSRRRRQS